MPVPVILQAFDESNPPTVAQINTYFSTLAAAINALAGEPVIEWGAAAPTSGVFAPIAGADFIGPISAPSIKSGSPISSVLTVADMARGCHVYLANSLVLAEATVGGTVPFDAEIMDVGAMHDPSLNPDRITVGAGISMVIIMADIGFNLFQTTGSDYVIAQLYKNGAAINGGPSFKFTNSEGGLTVIKNFSFSTPPLAVTAGDYFTIHYDFVTASEISPLLRITAQSFFGAVVIPQ